MMAANNILKAGIAIGIMMSEPRPVDVRIGSANDV